MGLSFATNIASLKVQNNLQQTTSTLNTSFQRLSSGLRINSAADDPAGLQLADSLRTDARIASVAMRNANDGISLTSIAEAALSEIGNMLSRMSELAEQSANGVYTNQQRSTISAEFVALASEIERVAVSTKFNDRALLANSQETTLQIGLDSSANSRITLDALDGTLAALGLAQPGSSALSFSVIATTSTASEAAARTALDAVKGALNSLNSQRGMIGATESRLSHAIDNLAVVRENYIAAESRIRDADVAQEVAEMVRLQILQQANAAVMAQANMQPQVILQLLS